MPLEKLRKLSSSLLELSPTLESNIEDDGPLLVMPTVIEENSNISVLLDQALRKATNDSLDRRLSNIR